MVGVTSDAFLVVGLAILILLVLIINIYVLVTYQHPDDKNQAYFPKLIIIAGLQLSAMCILLIPVGKF